MRARLSRRAVLVLGGAAGLAALVPAAAGAQSAPRGWVEVTGSAHVAAPADRDAARRRALADALLAAALAGGADVRGHSVLSNTRMTSDLLVVRPVGRILAHRVVSETLDAGLWRVRIHAQVGAPAPGACPDRRRLVVTAYPPQVAVSPQAPAWADALGGALGLHLVGAAARHPAVAELARAERLPSGDPARDRTDYRVLTRGGTRPAAGGHGLHIALEIAPAGGDLALTAQLRLDGPAGERIAEIHRAAVRLPGPSLLGRAAPLAQPDREALAQSLALGVVPALDTLFARAGCQPVQARMTLVGGALRVAAGRVHGLSRTSLAFTAEGDRTIEMLELVALDDRSATLAPLDPTRPLAAFDGRAVRFLDTAGPLP
jgi:hypothetical protein